MSTRRSRIKAVANLPARRSRPPAANEIKKESNDNSDGDDVLTSQNAKPVSCIKALGPAENGKEASVHQQSDDSEKCQGSVDRKSVIVSVDKDRKCVIVNSDDCIGLAKSKCTSEDKRKEANEAEIANLSISSQSHASPPSSSKDPSQSKALHKNLEENESPSPNENLASAKESEKNVLHPPDCTLKDADKQANGEIVTETTPSSVESSSAASKRAPLRSRRSKPTVNLTAATRKRATIETVAPSPCSPPPKKIKIIESRQHRSSESENNNELTSPTSLDEKSCSSKTPCNELTDPPQNLSSSLLSPEAAVRPSLDESSIFKTPLSSSLRVKDPHHGTASDVSIKSDGLPSTPNKESSALKRKQSTNAQRVAAARKTLRSRLSSDGAPPRSRLTMFDLIFYNPSQNPMISTDSSPKKPRPRMDSVSSVSSIHEDRLNEESVDDVESERPPEHKEEDSAMPVPQVKVGPDGSLILDEQSIVIETTGSKKSREELERSGVIIDTKSTYGHYKKIIRSKDWSDHETKKFYRALNVVGTDFSLMKPYFRKRTRRELKLKFKKEEKLNPNLVNKALGEPLDFDISELEKECELEDEEEKRLVDLAKEKATDKSKDKVNEIQEKSNKKPLKKKAKKQSRLMAEMEVESDAPSKKPISKGVPKKEKQVLDGKALKTPLSKGVPKKAKQILDQNAEDDYNSLAMGVDTEIHKKVTKKAPAVASSSVAHSKILEDSSVEPVKEDIQHKTSKSLKKLTLINTSRSPKDSLPVKFIQEKALKTPSIPKNSTVALGISPLVNKTVSVISNVKGVSVASPSISKPVISYHVSQRPDCKSSTTVAQSSNSQTPKSVIISTPVAATTSSGAPQVPCSPKTPIPIVQTSPLNTPLRVPILVSPGMTPKTIQIVKGQPLPSKLTLASRNNSGTSGVLNSKQLSQSPSPTASGPVPALVASSSLSTPSPKIASSNPLSSFSTVQFTPQSMPSSGVTTPVSRLLPSTPPLPRMEPGSIIVLKTPLPQNPDRHILQVYMVTNTPQGSSPSPVTLSPGVFTSGTNLLTGPGVQPAPTSNKSPCISDESDCERVLTKL